MKIKITKTETGFVGNHYYSDNIYLQLGLHPDSDFSKVYDGNEVEAERVSEIITVKGGRVPTTWSFFKVL